MAVICYDPKHRIDHLAVYVGANFLVDILYGMIDPRIRLGKG